MNTAVKVGLIAAGAGLAFWAGSKVIGALNLAQNISFRLTDFGIPRISNNIMSIPVHVEINNPTDTVLMVDSVDVVISMVKGERYERIGQANIQNVATEQGITQKTFTAQFDLKAIKSDLFETLAQVLTSRMITIRADVQIVAEGAGLPLQTITKSISV